MRNFVITAFPFVRCESVLGMQSIQSGGCLRAKGGNGFLETTHEPESQLPVTSLEAGWREAFGPFHWGIC